MSPHTNKKIDEFGDGVAGRSGGIQEEEAVVFARLMETYGADAINFSAGTYASWDVIVPCVGCTQRCMSFNDHDTLQEGDWGVPCIFNPMSNKR